MWSGQPGSRIYWWTALNLLRTSSQSCWIRSEGCRSSPRLRRNEEAPPYPLPFIPHLPSSCHTSVLHFFFFFFTSFLHQIMRCHSSASFVRRVWTSYIHKILQIKIISDPVQLLSLLFLPCTTLRLSEGGAGCIVSRERAVRG